VYALPAPPLSSAEEVDGYMGCFNDNQPAARDMRGVLEGFRGFKPVCERSAVDGGCVEMTEPSFAECALL